MATPRPLAVPAVDLGAGRAVAGHRAMPAAVLVIERGGCGLGIPAANLWPLWSTLRPG